MSNAKPCEGVRLAPMKGSQMIRAAPVAEEKGRYVPPSARKDLPPEIKALTAEELGSKELFPTLKAGASWSQIRTRLALPVQDFKGTIQQRLEREKKELEQGIQEELETDPMQMTEAKLARDGWVTRKLPVDLAGHHEFIDRFARRHVIEPEDYWNAKTEWTTFGVPEGYDRNLVECVNIDGTPIERSKASENSYSMGQAISYDMAREKSAKEKLLSFVGL